MPYLAAPNPAVLDEIGGAWHKVGSTSLNTGASRTVPCLHRFMSQPARSQRRPGRSSCATTLSAMSAHRAPSNGKTLVDPPRNLSSSVARNCRRARNRRVFTVSGLSDKSRAISRSFIPSASCSRKGRRRSGGKAAIAASRIPRNCARPKSASGVSLLLKRFRILAGRRPRYRIPPPAARVLAASALY